MSDPTIAQIEAELRESRFAPWDVERFLAERHQAKIEALTVPSENEWARRWVVAKELATLVLAFIGLQSVLIIGALWMLWGEFPIHPAG